VQVQPVTKEIADSLGMKEAEGALVAGIRPPGSPAVQVGLKVGDAIALVNGKKIRDSRDLARHVAPCTPTATFRSSNCAEARRKRRK
jgi:serine protease Do